jgi:glycosidase
MKRKLMNIVLAACCYCVSELPLHGQVHTIDRIDPPHWFTGMEDSRVELLVRGQNLLPTRVSADRNCQVVAVELAENHDFMYVTLETRRMRKPGIVTLVFEDETGRLPIEYAFRQKQHKPVPHGPSDLMYLAMPDRFANGESANDTHPAMAEASDRTAPKGRHGGDLAGLSEHLAYLRQLGVTSLWLNPVQENNQPSESYHGYAITDHYTVDRRLGTLSEYLALSAACKAAGIKMVMDVIYNHWGSEHYLNSHLPDTTWVNWHDGFVRTNYRAETLMDPHASTADRKRMTDGWFDHPMPDLNQRNPHLARYLIQNTLWWIETAQLDGLRIDTYAYPDAEFMRNLCRTLAREYADLFVFGETWVQGSPIQAWFTRDHRVSKLGAFSEAVPVSLTDFQLYYAITEGLNEPFGWTTGLSKIQLTLAHDYLYPDPSRLVTFLDNHDLGRIYSVLGEDFLRWKMAMALLLTTRGIPCIYYGTEVLMKNLSNPDALVREEFPGGWPDHPLDKFSSSGRTGAEQEAFTYIQRIQQWKHAQPWMAQAQLTQFVPENGLYTYVRHACTSPCSRAEPLLLVAMNQQKEPREMDWSRLTEFVAEGDVLEDILSGIRYEAGGPLAIEPGTVLMLVRAPQ